MKSFSISNTKLNKISSEQKLLKISKTEQELAGTVKRNIHVPKTLLTKEARDWKKVIQTKYREWKILSPESCHKKLIEPSISSLSEPNEFLVNSRAQVPAGSIARRSQKRLAENRKMKMITGCLKKVKQTSNSNIDDVSHFHTYWWRPSMALVSSRWSLRNVLRGFSELFHLVTEALHLFCWRVSSRFNFPGYIFRRDGGTKATSETDATPWFMAIQIVCFITMFGVV